MGKREGNSGVNDWIFGFFDSELVFIQWCCPLIELKYNYAAAAGGGEEENPLTNIIQEERVDSWFSLLCT